MGCHQLAYGVWSAGLWVWSAGLWGVVSWPVGCGQLACGVWSIGLWDVVSWPVGCGKLAYGVWSAGLWGVVSWPVGYGQLGVVSWPVGYGQLTTCICIFQELFSEEDFVTSRWLLAEVNIDKPGRKTNRTVDVEGASVRLGVVVY